MNKKWLALMLKLVVSGSLILYLVYNIDLESAEDRLAQAEPLMLLVAALMLLFQIIIGGFRWTTVLRAIGVGMRFWEAVRLFYIGSFFNQALPGGTGGDAVRIYMVYKSDWGLRAAVNGVVLERVVTILALVILVVVTLPFLLGSFDGTGKSWVLISVAFVGLATAIGLCALCMLDKLPAVLSEWQVVRGLGNLARDARAVFLKTSVVLSALAWSVLGHVNIGLAVYILARGLKLEIDAFDCIVLMPPVLLVMTIPISIGAWGVRENAMVVAFGLIGVSPEAATVLGLLLGLVGLIIAIPGGIFWLSGRKRGEPSLVDVEVELASADPKGTSC